MRERQHPSNHLPQTIQLDSAIHHVFEAGGHVSVRLAMVFNRKWRHTGKVTGASLTQLKAKPTVDPALLYPHNIVSYMTLDSYRATLKLTFVVIHLSHKPASRITVKRSRVLPLTQSSLTISFSNTTTTVHLKTVKIKNRNLLQTPVPLIKSHREVITTPR